MTITLDRVAAAGLEVGDLIDVTAYVEPELRPHYAYGIVESFRPYGGLEPEWSMLGALAFRFVEIDGAVTTAAGTPLTAGVYHDVRCPLDRVFEVIR